MPKTTNNLQKNRVEGRILRLLSPAKINLFLEVFEKLPCGKHKIQTIFSAINLFDAINFTLTKDGAVKFCANESSINNIENLSCKMAFFLKEKYCVKEGVEIYLEKNIPIAAGLGGGSGNAAVTLEALKTLWNLQISDEETHKIAANFGSDINFFLSGGTAKGENRGEIVSSLPYLPIKNIFLTNPGFAISSKEAYEAIEFNFDFQNCDKLLQTRNSKFAFNRLEKGICEKYPIIAEAIENLKEMGMIQAILSGSGPTIVGFASSPKIANRASEFYTKKGWWNKIVETIPKKSNW